MINLRGHPWPWGATEKVIGRQRGVNFAVYSRHASQLYLNLYPEQGLQPLAQLTMQHGEGDIWHCFVADIGHGQRYSLVAEGPPDGHHRFCSQKSLLDPYARDVERHYDAPQLGDTYIGRVYLKSFDWQGVSKPARHWQDGLIYEAHVRGLTQQNPHIPPRLRGTYLGVCHPWMLDYLTALGVTTLEILPCMVFHDLAQFRAVGLSNFWGYDPVNWFAPDPRYAISDPVAEFKTMVRELHRAGIELVLDVVFNHSGEGDLDLPPLSLQGLDAASYYLAEGDSWANWSGCGNTLNGESGAVRQLWMDALRYWASEMQVDGFRFDLGPVVGRQGGNFDAKSSFFKIVEQEPALCGIKLIAEPWDLGPEGYRLGGFPPQWGEWNDQFRDTLRRFWLVGDEPLAHFADVFAGSQKLFGSKYSAHRSINMLTSHDGFTLRDLLSYNHKHNAANGEHNRDGHHHNYSNNCGVEGDSDDPQVVALRLQQAKNLLLCALLAKGTPQLLAGDELWNSQQGNNNPYCQDNPIGWLDWSGLGSTEFESDLGDLRDFIGAALALRQQIAVISSADFYRGASEQGLPDILWCDFSAMPVVDWQDRSGRLLVYWQQAEGDGVLRHALLLNAGPQSATAILPHPGAWQCCLASVAALPEEIAGEVSVPPYSAVVYRQRTTEY